MDLLKVLRHCLVGDEDHFETTSAEKARSEEDITKSILSILFTAEKPGADLDRRLCDEVHTSGWYEGLAKRILEELEKALNAGKHKAGAMKTAYDDASKVAKEFTKEHPVLVAAMATVVAIGILVILLPWAVEALGFGARGPMIRSFAARWQSSFPDVPKEAWFGWFQRLGMRWGKK